MRRYLRKLYKKDDGENKKTIEDSFTIEFDTAMNVDEESVDVEVVDVVVSEDDLDIGEELPPGGIIKVLQIIAQAEMPNKKKQRSRGIRVGGRKAALGKEPSGRRIDEQKQQQEDEEEEEEQQKQQELQRRLVDQIQEENRRNRVLAHQQQLEFAARPPLPPAGLLVAFDADSSSMDEREGSRKRTRTTARTHNIVPDPSL